MSVPFPLPLRSSLAAGLCMLALAGPDVSIARAQAHGASAPHLTVIHGGYLTVGSHPAYPPMESVEKRTGRFVGVDIDLASALAKAMGLKGSKIVNNPFATMQSGLFNRRFDVIMSSMSDTTARRKTIAFVDYMRGEEAIVARKSSGIYGHSYAALCGRVVSVEAGTTELDGLERANQHCEKKITIRRYTHDTDAFEALISSRSQAYTGDYVVAAQYVRQHAGILKLAGKIVPSGRPYGIGLLKSNSALKVALQLALVKIRANGNYKAILTKWHVGLAHL